jgi:hypothetical protein
MLPAAHAARAATALRRTPFAVGLAGAQLRATILDGEVRCPARSKADCRFPPPRCWSR